MPHVASLHRYPIKSCRGEELEMATIDHLGIVGDRRFLIVDTDGRFITQRETPLLARIDASVSASAIRLSLEDGVDGEKFPLPSPDSTDRDVVIWRDTVRAVDCGDAAATWLSVALGRPVRLVTVGAGFQRPVAVTSVEDTTGRHETAFADAYPLLIISQASLDDLNDRLAEPLPIDRFRPNIVVGDCEPFAEDRWKRIRIGDVVLRAAAPCARCVVTTTDQHTLSRDPEPLRTLATYRRDADGHVNFGQNYLHETTTGILRPGMPVEVLG